MKEAKESKGRGRPVGSTKKKDEAAKPEKGNKKKLAVKETKLKKKPQAKGKKDPNQPKRPPTAFFIFLEEFRQTYKEQHPDVKGVAAVGKAGGDKWKQLTDEEKAVYASKAAQRKADYDKNMAAYNKKKKDDEEQEASADEESKENDEGSVEEDEEDDDD